MHDDNKLKVLRKAHSFTLYVYECVKEYRKEEIFCFAKSQGVSAAFVPVHFARGSASKSKDFFIQPGNVSNLKEIIFNRIYKLLYKVKGMLIAVFKILHD